ncbi:MAG: recombinase RecB [Rubinisphaera sp.]|nr:recombinase RecB [Rubinisphaera sp.]
MEFHPLASEAKLEKTLVADLSLLGSDLMLIGQQVTTAFGKYIDLLAMDSEGNLVVIELKRDKTPREVVAQALDYASWVDGLSYNEIAELYAAHNTGEEFEKGFAEVFGSSPPDTINESHQMIVVASELDPSTERIINYLSNNYGVPINTVFFRHFADNGSEYLTRTWLIDPQEVETKASKSTVKKKQESWNGRDFYVNQGESLDMNWDDCRKYGFVTGGGGLWYSKTLNHLYRGSRIFVNIPKVGYVGVGIVKETSVMVKDFKVEVDGRMKPILECDLIGKQLGNNSDNPDLSNYAVRVDWIKTLPRDQAYWEKGLFAQQNTACKLRSQFTIERLVKHFGLEE